jgi:pilus assembly protein FimV
MKLHVVGCLLLLLTAVSVLPAPAATVSDRVESRAQTLDSSKVYTTPLCGGDNCKSRSGRDALKPQPNTAAPAKNSGRHKPVPWTEVSSREKNNTTSAGSVKKTTTLELFSNDYFDRSFPDTVDFSTEGRVYNRNGNEGLWRIAENTRGGLPLYKQMSAVYRKNLACFVKGNINEIVPGCRIVLPTREQAEAEYEEHGRNLLYFAGVDSARYQYALENCRYGICKFKKDQSVKDSGSGETAAPAGETPSIAVAKVKEEDRNAAKTATTDVDLKNAKLEKLDIKLVDENGRAKQNVLIGKNGENIDGTSLSMLDQESFDKYNRELNAQLDKKFGEPIEQLRREIIQLNKNQVTMNQQLQEDIKALNQRIDNLSAEMEKKLAQLPEQMPSPAQQVVVQEDSNLKIWVVVVTIILCLMSVAAYYIMSKTRKMQPDDDVGDEDDEGEDISDGIDGLMTINTAMNADGLGDLEKTSPETSDASSEINLNTGETDQVNQEKKEFILEDGSLEQSSELVPPDLKENSEPVQENSSGSGMKLELDLNELGDEKPIARQEKKPDAFDFDFDVWDENSFDLAENLDTPEKLDEFIQKLQSKDAEAEGGKELKTVDDILNSIGEQDDNQPADAASGGTDSPAAADSVAVSDAGDTPGNDDLDDLINQVQSAPKADDKVSNDDLDDLISQVQSAPKADDKVSNDDLDDLISQVQSAPKADDKVSNDDLDDLISQVQSAPKADDKVSNDDLDDLISQVQSAPKADDKVSNDDLDDLISQVQSAPKADDKVSNDDLDDLISQVQSAPKADDKVSNDDLDDLITQVQSAPKADDKVSNDDLDDLITQVQSAPKADDKVSNDDLDDLISQVQSAPKKEARPDDKLNNDELDDLISSIQAEPAPKKEARPDDKLNNDELDDLINSIQAEPAPKKEARPDDKLNNDELDDLINSVQASKAPQKKAAATEKLSKDELDDLLSSIRSEPAARKKADNKQSAQASPGVKPAASAVRRPAGPASAKTAGSGASAKVKNDEIDDILGLVKDPNGQKALDDQINNLIDQAQEEMNRYEPDREEEEMTEDEENLIKLAQAFIGIDDKQGARDILQEIMKTSNTKAFTKASKMLEKL